VPFSSLPQERINIPSREAAAGCKAHNFRIAAHIGFKYSLFPTQSPEALASGAGLITPADKYPNSYFLSPLKAPLTKYGSLDIFQCRSA
jgi:hypothetical protein